MFKCSTSKFFSISEHYWALISISECFRAFLNIVEHCLAFLRIPEMLGWDAWLRCSEQFGHSESNISLDGLGLESLESCLKLMMGFEIRILAVTVTSIFWVIPVLLYNPLTMMRFSTCAFSKDLFVFKSQCKQKMFETGMFVTPAQ